MGYYNVVQPDVVVDGLHYVHPTPHNEPIEVDDDTAAELVADGKLTPYHPDSSAKAVSDLAERPIEYRGQVAAVGAQGVAKALAPVKTKAHARGRSAED